jgi:hypothetical protein
MASGDDLLADDQGQGVDGGGDEDPFGHAQLLTLHDQACVQPQTDEGVGDDEEDPFRDLCSQIGKRFGRQTLFKDRFDY